MYIALGMGWFNRNYTPVRTIMSKPMSASETWLLAVKVTLATKHGAKRRSSLRLSSIDCRNPQLLEMTGKSM